MTVSLKEKDKRISVYLLFIRLFFLASALILTWTGPPPLLAVEKPVEIMGQELLVNGNQFVIKGVGYSPVPIGADPEKDPPFGDYFTIEYKSIYNRDLPLIREMGANVLRINNWNISADHSDFLDRAYNGGSNPIYIIAGFRIAPGLDINPVSPTNVREQLKADFRKMVAIHKNYPAILMWAIGNNLNSSSLYGKNLDDLFSLIDEMALVAHLEEGTNFHPVTVNLADESIADIVSRSDTAKIDIWGVNVNRGASFGSFFDDYKSISDKPLLVMEFGIDAYDERTGDEYEKGAIPYQATYAELLWNEISKNGDICIGGVIKSYSDELWWGKYGNTIEGCPDQDPEYHSICAHPSNTDPDGYVNYEWFGLMRASKNVLGPDIMEPRAIYHTMKSLWSPEGDKSVTRRNASFYASSLMQSAKEDYKNKDWEKAKGGYMELVNNFPDDPNLGEAHLMLGDLLEETDYDEAVYNFQKAEKLVPGTRIAHKAKNSLARLHFLIGDYAKAKGLVREVLHETKDWDMVKYATALLKQMDFITYHLADNKEPGTQSCGTKALAKILELKGKTSEETELKEQNIEKDLVVSFYDLKKIAENKGLKASGLKFSGKELEETSTEPWIAHLKQNHFVTVIKIDGQWVNIVDPDTGEAKLTRPEFLKRWSGYGLVFSEDAGKIGAAIALDTEKMKEIRGGHHLHGNNNGGPEGSPPVHFDPGPSDPGGNNCIGMPHLMVNLANFNFIVQDTDFSYSGRGPGVSITRTYNADDPGEGIFGRSWTSNYEMKLTEIPGGNVDIRRESGKIDHFSRNGDGTYTSPRWVYDVLIKNGDGTFSLKMKGSKLIKHFNAQGQLTSIADRNGHSITFQYDAGRLQSVTDAVGRVTLFTYWPNGKVWYITDPGGKVAYYYYDTSNNLERTVDAAGNEVSYAYNTLSYMTSLTTSKGTTTIENVYYDPEPAFGYVVKSITDPLLNKKSYSTDGYLVYVTDANGHLWSYFNQSPYGETTEVTDPLSNKTVRVAEYSTGNITSITDANENRTTMSYDGKGNITKITDPLVNFVQYTYDGNDNLVEVRDPKGNITTLRYNTNHNLTEIVDPENGEAAKTVFTYYPNGELETLTDPNNHIYHFTYDNHGNLETATNPVGGIDFYTYDETGRARTHTDPNLHTLSFTYDGIDRVRTVTYPDDFVKTYTYDCCGVATVADRNGTVTLQYNNANRLTQFTDAYGKIIIYEYDKAGNLRFLTYPGNKVVEYIYDNADRLTSVTNWLSNITRYEYDKGGRLTKTLYPDGSTILHGYDIANRLKSILDFRSDASMNGIFNYTLDSSGNRTDISSYQPLSAIPLPQNTGYTYGDDNRLLNAGSSSFIYDNNGNTIRKTIGSNITSFVWNYDNMLTQLVRGSDTYNYKYDGLGNRIAKNINSAETRYVVSPKGALSSVIAETDSGGNITSYYIFGHGLISKISSANEKYYYHYDDIGNTISLTDSSGNAMNKYAYDAFGKITAGEEAVPNPFKYVGRYGVMDDGNGLFYMRARYYDQEVGRFINKDPIEFDGGINMYSYVGNNPVNNNDPLGLKSCEYYDWTYNTNGGLYEGSFAPYFCEHIPDMDCMRECLQRDHYDRMPYKDQCSEKNQISPLDNIEDHIYCFMICGFR